MPKENTIEIKEFFECRVWVTECPCCDETMMLSNTPTVGDRVLCDHCETSFKVSFNTE